MSLIAENNQERCDLALADYAAGTLSPAKHLIITTQKNLSKDVAAHIELEECLAAQGLDDAVSETLSPSFLENVVKTLPPQNTPCINDNEQNPSFLNTIDNIKWRRLIPGIAVHDVIGARRFGGEDRLYLFNAKAGSKLPEHSHRGEEWVLVLKGSYKAGEQVYRKGDLHIVCGDESHNLQISEQEDCICLAMTQQPIKMKGFLPRVAQALIGL